MIKKIFSTFATCVGGAIIIALDIGVFALGFWSICNFFSYTFYDFAHKEPNYLYAAGFAGLIIVCIAIFLFEITIIENLDKKQDDKVITRTE